MFATELIGVISIGLLGFALALARVRKELASLIAPEAVFCSDGGGRVSAALNPIQGGDKVTRLIAGLSRRFYAEPATRMELRAVNGRLGVVMRTADGLLTVLTIESDGQHITALYAMRNPEKLARFAADITV